MVVKTLHYSFASHQHAIGHSFTSLHMSVGVPSQTKPRPNSTRLMQEGAKKKKKTKQKTKTKTRAENKTKNKNKGRQKTQSTKNKKHTGNAKAFDHVCARTNDRTDGRTNEREGPWRRKAVSP